jgi:alcohol dehydrogenase class IV
MFSFFSPQIIHFGRGQSEKTSQLAASFGQNVLLIHGASAGRADWLIAANQALGLTTVALSCYTEPSLPDIEAALVQLQGFSPDVVIGLGGGSVLDFAKALAALLPSTGPALSFLEILGDGRGLDADPIPMIALPTTAGTGAEVTKNAVISVPAHGLKVSLRDPRMIPKIAIVDAGLMQCAPKRVALSAGLDAITQVIEPYLCSKSNPVTDALCTAAIAAGFSVLRNLVEDDAPKAWDTMAWVSTCGGLALANAGLGAVHGFAGVIGGKKNAPHGEICGALLPAVLACHAQKARQNAEISRRLNWIFRQIDQNFAAQSPLKGLNELRSWSRAQGLRGLNAMGLQPQDHAEIATAAAEASSMRTTPFALTQDDRLQILSTAG